MSTPDGGRGWIRTTEAEKQQIYSLPPLATRELVNIKLDLLLHSRTGADNRFVRVDGAGGRTRTPDLLITNQLLYQLSYTSEFALQIAPHKGWSGRQDSNLRHLGPKPSTLPN